MCVKKGYINPFVLLFIFVDFDLLFFFLKKKDSRDNNIMFGWSISYVGITTPKSFAIIYILQLINLLVALS